MTMTALARKGAILFSAALAVVVLYSVLQASAANEISGNVIGVQYGNNYSTGIGPLPGTNVSIYNSTTGAFLNSTLTNETGRYYFEPVNSGSYNMTFTMAGYSSSAPPQPLNIMTSDTNRTLYLYMQNVGSFNATVVDDKNGRPIPGATVVVEHGACKVNNNCPRGVTDSSGNVMIGVKSDVMGEQVTHTFVVTGTGYSGNSTFTSSVSEGGNGNVQIRMKGEYRVFGYVKDAYRCSGCQDEYTPGAFLELRCGHRDSDPKLNWTNSYFYNTTSGSGGFYEIYYPSTLDCGNVWTHVQAAGYENTRESLNGTGTKQRNIQLTGSLFLSAFVVDISNKSHVLNATMTINSPLYLKVYEFPTNYGNISIRVKGGENHTLEVSKTGYGTYVDAFQYDTNHSYGQINLTGSGNMAGVIVDKYNNSILINNTNVSIISGVGPNYLTTSTGDGSFNLMVSSNQTYTLVFVRDGYKTKTLTGMTASNIGIIELEGNRQINGTVTDCFSNAQMSGNRISNVTVVIGSRIPSVPNTYTVFTDSSGLYNLQIPSTITMYNITFTQSSYQTRVIGYNDPTSQCLSGKIPINGTVSDRDAVESYRYLVNATVTVYDSLNRVYYTQNTGTGGNYSFYIGFLNSLNNFSVNITKPGYFTYTQLENTSWSSPNTELIGRTLVEVAVKDEYDSTPINGSEVCILMEEQEYNVYQNCIYTKFTDTSGSTSMNIKERGVSNKYDVQASKNGYSQKVVGPYSAANNLVLTLYAATTVHVTDSYATAGYQKISNASVILYYNFTQNKFQYNISQTILNVTAYCNSSQLNGINVTILCASCLNQFNQTLTTAGGFPNATFYRIPTGTYTITVNGSLAGCTENVTQRVVSAGGLTYTGGNFTFNTGIITALMYVTKPDLQPLENATVSMVSKPAVSCITDSIGLCRLSYVTAGLQEMKGAANHYYDTLKNYTVSASLDNDFTAYPLVMNAHTGNLSVRVLNETGPMVLSVAVNVTNSTNTYSGTTNAQGWANFTNIANTVNITANGTLRGYNYSIVYNKLVEPDNLTVVSISLEENWIRMFINKFEIAVSDANTTLWNGAAIATNSSGNQLTAMTSPTGYTVFRRIPYGTYTLTITKPSEGIDVITDVFILNLVDISIDVNDTMNPWYDTDSLGDNSTDYGTVYTGQPVEAICDWSDDAGLDTAILDTNKTGWVNESVYLGGNGVFDEWSIFTIDTSGYSGNLTWRIWAYDTSDKWNVTQLMSFIVVDNEAPVATASGDNSSLYTTFVEGRPVRAYAYWTENVGLRFAKLETNSTGSWQNVSNMTLSGTGAWSNFTINTSGFAGRTLSWRIWANDSSNNWNATDQFNITIPENILAVYVVTSEDGAVGADDLGNGVQINVSNSTGSWVKNTTSIGHANFTLSPGTYNISVNGTRQGYGLNSSLNYPVVAGTNIVTMYVNTTKMAVNVTNPTGTTLDNVNITLFNSTSPATRGVVKNATGHYQNLTGVYGYQIFKRLLPCSGCNVSIWKATNTNSTTFSILAGNQLYVHLDPPAPAPGQGLDNWLMNLTFNLTTPGLDASILDNITITLWQTGGATNYSNATVNGITIINSVPSGYYNITIDGEAFGFSKIVNTNSTGIGKVVANSGKTNNFGFISLPMNGMDTYFVRVAVSGYNGFDDIDNGSLGKVGTQTVYVPLEGTVNVSGNVSDIMFYTKDPTLGYEPVDLATVSFYRSSSCASLDENSKRYVAFTGTNGKYSLKMSPAIYGVDSDNQESYCIKTTADGYNANTSGPTAFSGINATRDIWLLGDSYAQGVVRDIITTDYINGSLYATSVKLKSKTCYGSSGCDAYSVPTNGAGAFFFNVSSRDRYTPYNMTINAQSSGWCIYNYSISGMPYDGTHYLIGSEYAKLNISVWSGTGEPMTSNVTITVRDLTTGSTIILGSPPTCTYDDTVNMLSCYVTSGTKTLTINGSSIGFGINQTTFMITSSNCQLETRITNATINSTDVNITLRDNSGNLIDNMSVSMNSSLYEGTTVNGSVIFQRVVAGIHNISFAGNMTEIYFYNSSNRGVIIVTPESSGSIIKYNFTFNETRAMIRITNETGYNVSGVSASFTNLRTGEVSSQTTDQNGSALLTALRYGNLSVTFNNTQLYLLGLIPPASAYYLNVIPGANENGSNNLSVPLNDTEASFTIRNSTAGLVNTSVTMYMSGAPASNGFGNQLTGLTASGGILTLHNVIPSDYTAGHNYTYVVDANASGYGRWSFSLDVDPAGVSVTRTLEPLNLTVYIYNENGGALGQSVNVSLLKGGAVSTNVFGQYMNATTSTTASFTYLYVANYTVLVNSSGFFSQDTIFNTESLSSPIQILSAYMIERTLHVYVRDTDGTTLDNPVNISLVNTTGGSINGTNGSAIFGKTGVTNYTKFEYIPDGEYIINITSNYYFIANWTFNTTSLYAISNTRTFTLHSRSIPVYLVDFKTSSYITDSMNAAIVNGTGDVMQNTTSSWLNGTTATGIITFYGIPDGSWFVRTLATVNRSADNRSLDTSSFSEDSITLRLKKVDLGYINVTTRTGSSSLGGVTLTLINDTNSTDTSATDSGGYGILEANASLYTGNLTVSASMSGYYSNSTTGLLITAGQVNATTIYLTAIPSQPPGPGGGTTYSPGPSGPSGVGACTESWSCTEWSECSSQGAQTRVCNDSKKCGTRKNKPTETNSCVPKKKDMRISLSSIPVNAGSCGTVNLYIDNNGTAGLENVYASPSVSIPDCCRADTSRSVSLIPAGSRDSIPVSICVDKKTEKGIYRFRIKATSGELSREVESTVSVAKTYPETILDEIRRLSAELALKSGELSFQQGQYYAQIMQVLNEAKNHVTEGNIEGAETSMAKAKELKLTMESAPATMGMETLMMVIFLPVLPIGIVLFWWYLGRREHTIRRKRASAMPVAPLETADRGAIIALFNEINKRLSKLSTDDMTNRERYYHDNLSRLMVDIGRHIGRNDFRSAVEYIENAEKYMRLLEDKPKEPEF